MVSTATTPSTPASTPATTVVPPSQSSTPPANTCRQLTVRVLEGGAIHGQEIAAALQVSRQSVHEKHAARHKATGKETN